MENEPSRREVYTLTIVVKQVDDKWSIPFSSNPPLEEIHEVSLLTLTTALASELARRNGADYTLEQIAKTMVGLKRHNWESSIIKTKTIKDEALIHASNALLAELKQRGINAECGLREEPRGLVIILMSGATRDQIDFTEWMGIDVHVVYEEEIFPPR